MDAASERGIGFRSLDYVGVGSELVRIGLLWSKHCKHCEFCFLAPCANSFSSSLSSLGGRAKWEIRYGPGIDALIRGSECAGLDSLISLGRRRYGAALRKLAVTGKVATFRAQARMQPHESQRQEPFLGALESAQRGRLVCLRFTCSHRRKCHRSARILPWMFVK